MATIQRAASAVFGKNLGVKRDESVLIVTDTKKEAFARVFLREARKITRKAVMISMAPRKVNGEEPTKKVAEAMKNADVAVLITHKSLSHTKARINATKKGARIASVPGIKKATIGRCLAIDYERVKELTNRIADIIDRTSKVRIRTRLGTDITMSIKGRRCHGRSAGIFRKKGEWGNLPEGDACLAPVKGKTEGIFICDTTNPLKNTLLREPIKVTVRKGYAVSIGESKEAEMIFRELKELGRNSLNVAELGIGTNHRARISGTVLEDEKVMGTCHIALGNSISMGGRVNAKSHLDFVMRKPDIWFDKRKIMSSGKFHKL